jgi:hypothetical protein
MNTRIIGSIVLGSLCLVMHPGASAGKVMLVGVTSPTGCYQSGCDGFPLEVETGTEAFRDAVSQAVGAAAGVQADCPSAHVYIEPKPDGGVVTPAC